MRQKLWQERMGDLSNNISYHVIRGGLVDNVVAYNPESDEPLFQADSNHPNWQAIMDGLAANDQDVFDLFDVNNAVKKRVEVLSERVTYDKGTIRFDGEVQDGPLAEHLVKVVQSGTGDYDPVVKFWELVAQNPSEHSRKALYTWLEKHEFTIDTDGYIVAYKSVNGKAGDQDNFRSTHAGHAFVDGVEFTDDYIPCVPGSVISMPRGEVDDNHNKACSTGLHFGDWSYAHNFTGAITVEVRVNPRDVVSIPSDDARKARCCRLEIVAEVTGPVDGPVKLNVSDDSVGASAGYRPFV